MISYKSIGHWGRLGNQMFQFAATLGIARRLGYDVKFPVENITTTKLEHFSDGKSLDVIFDMPKVFKLHPDMLAPASEITCTREAREQYFHYDSTMVSVEDGTNLLGYFQSDQYFSHIDEELRSLLSFQDNIVQQAVSLFPAVDGQTVSIHIRRGDYVNQPQFHPTCSPEYYSKAASLFGDSPTFFIIFSDDIAYCRTLFAESENVLYVDNTDPYIDLCLMSMCDHNIIANSSFSWWGAWLNNNPNKIVVAPNQWFGPAYTHNTRDLYCNGWITL